MSDYSPYQYSLARAQVAGNAVQGVGSALVDFGTKMSSILQQKDLNKKIAVAYNEAVNSFAARSMEIDPSMPREKAVLGAMRFIKKPMDEFGAEANIKLLLDASVRAETYLDGLKTKLDTEQKSKKNAAAAEAAVQLQREYGPEQNTGQGFTEQDLISERSAPQYQEDAMANYGKAAAAGQAPVQTTDQLRQQPSVAALPKRPELDKDAWYKKARLALDKLKLDADKRKTAKGDEEEINKNIRWASDNAIDLGIQAKKDQNIIAKLKQAALKLGESGILPMNIQQDLSSLGVETEGLSLDEIKDNISKYEDLVEESKTRVTEMEEIKKGLRQGKSLRRALPSKPETEQITATDTYTKAIQHIQDKIAPIMSTMNGSTRQLLLQLPEEYRPVVQEKIRQAKAAGYSDFDILNLYLRGKKK